MMALAGCGAEEDGRGDGGLASATSMTASGEASEGEWSSGGSSESSGGAGGSDGASSSSGGEDGCGGAAALIFTSPGATAENPIWLEVAAEGAVARVVYSAEGIEALGESEDAEGGFGVEATVAVLGPRTLQARGYDACGGVIAAAEQVTVVGEGGSGEDSGGGGPGEVCYLGPTKAGDVCWPLVSPALPEGYAYPPPLDGDPNYRAPIAWLDISGIDPATAIAPNFQLGEVARADFGPYVVVQPAAIVRLQALRDALGALQVTSGYRNPTHNASVGGATWSRHMYGDAFDLKPLSSSLQALFERCGVEGAGFRQLYEDHVHCDWRNVAVDPGFFGAAEGAASGGGEEARAAMLVAEGDGWAAPATGWDEGEPLREWTARDAEGSVLARATGRRFVAPVGTARVEVRVGGEVMRARTLP